jgi:hypothetical protein
MSPRHAAPGNSTETASFAAEQLSRQMQGRALPEAAWQRTNLRDASTCADPGFAGDSRAAQHDKSEILRQTEKYQSPKNPDFAFQTKTQQAAYIFLKHSCHYMK